MKRATVAWFERIVRILPRANLESLAGIDRPWQADRNHLESVLISKDSRELREELLDIIKSGLML